MQRRDPFDRMLISQATPAPSRFPLSRAALAEGALDDGENVASGGEG